MHTQVEITRNETKRERSETKKRDIKREEKKSKEKIIIGAWIYLPSFLVLRGIRVEQHEVIGDVCDELIMSIP